MGRWLSFSEWQLAPALIKCKVDACIQGPPIAAYLYDAYGGQAGGLHAYKPAIWYAGSMALGSAGFVVGMRMLTKPGVFVRA